MSVFADSEAFVASLKVIKEPSAKSRAEFAAIQNDGRIFDLPNGTRVSILSEVPIVGAYTAMWLNVESGAHSGQHVLAYSVAVVRQ